MQLFASIVDLFKKGINPKNLEERLIKADFDISITQLLVNELKNSKFDKIAHDLKSVLSSILLTKPVDIDRSKTNILVIVGVNGVGKTTLISKMALYYKTKGYSVAIAAADTYRAAAIEQLEFWAKKIDIECYRQQPGSDPAAVVYDAIDSSLSANKNILIIDTAGRLQNKNDLLQQLLKINKVIDKKSDLHPGKITKSNILVLDANIGKNSLNQAEIFNKMIHLDFYSVTKLDSTAKGGILFSVCKQFNIPLAYASFGEKQDQLITSDASNFKEFIVGKI